MSDFFYKLFFVILLCSEFYYVPVGGGVARLYHFFAIAVILALRKSFTDLFKSSTFIAICLFVSINIFAILFSDFPVKALASFCSFLGNIGVAIATALILISGKISLKVFKRMIMGITIVSILWAVIQILSFKYFGKNLALSSQQEPQIMIGFGPGFRTEANAFGKFLSLPFLLFLPEIVQKKRPGFLGWAYLIIAVGIVVNFTRTSIYGIGIAMIFFVFSYFKSRTASKLVIRGGYVAIVFSIFVFASTNGWLGSSEYGSFKMQNLFNQEEVLEGGSSAYRLESMQAVLDNTLPNPKRVMIGNGWGQTYVEVRGEEIQAGGGDSVNILGYSGAIGVLFYLFYSLAALWSARMASKHSMDIDLKLLAEGVFFAGIGIFATSQIAGCLITPEYWMLMGICMYFGVSKGRPPRIVEEVLTA